MALSHRMFMWKRLNFTTYSDDPKHRHSGHFNLWPVKLDFYFSMLFTMQLPHALHSNNDLLQRDGMITEYLWIFPVDYVILINFMGFSFETNAACEIIIKAWKVYSSAATCIISHWRWIYDDKISLNIRWLRNWSILWDFWKNFYFTRNEQSL